MNKDKNTKGRPVKRGSGASKNIGCRLSHEDIKIIIEEFGDFRTALEWLSDFLQEKVSHEK